MRDNERVLTLKQVKDAARLLLSMRDGVIPGAEQGIKSLVGILAVVAQDKK